MTPPIWRRVDADGTAARLGAFALLFGAIALAAILIAVPLHNRLLDAQASADALDQRAAALLAAAADRRREAELAPPPSNAVEAAEAWLKVHAPKEARETAELALITAIRLIAEDASVTLNSVAAAKLPREAANAAAALGDAGISLLAVEARISADHKSLARFLTSVETAQPKLRVAALDVVARTSRADQEDDRLTVRALVAAMIRAGD